MTQQLIADLWFERLAELLKDRKLPCENGPARICSPDEFMYMQESAGQGHFKHSDSRNYVIVRPAPKPRVFPSAFELFVPCTTEPFHRGFFDSFEFSDA